MSIKILQKEAPVLREVAKELPLDNIKSSKIKKIIDEMKMALDSQEDGVAIAAPQIGYALRIFVVSKKVEEILEEAEKNKLKKSGKTEKTKTKVTKKVIKIAQDLVFINPVIKKISKERKTVEEGCLSVRYLYGQVSRSTKATIVALDEFGNKFERGGTGLMAQIFQHEMDHLDGVLFIDKAKNVEEIFPDEIKTNGSRKRSQSSNNSQNQK